MFFNDFKGVDCVNRSFVVKVKILEFYKYIKFWITIYAIEYDHIC